MLHDPKFWLAISFFIFCIISIKYILPIINGKIKKSIFDINNKLDELSKKKEILTKEIKHLESKKHDMLNYQNKLINDANIEIKNLKKNAELELKEKMIQEERIANKRLNDEELRLITHFKEKIVVDLIANLSNKMDNFNNKDKNKILANILS